MFGGLRGDGEAESTCLMRIRGCCSHSIGAPLMGRLHHFPCVGVSHQFFRWEENSRSIAGFAPVWSKLVPNKNVNYISLPKFNGSHYRGRTKEDHTKNNNRGVRNYGKTSISWF